MIINVAKLQEALINKLKVTDNTQQPFQDIQYVWQGRTVTVRVLDTGNQQINALMRGTMDSVTAKATVETILQRKIASIEAKDPIKLADEIAKFICKPDFSMIDELKKNRNDKRDTKAPFTTIKIKPIHPDVVDEEVILLNTVPDEVLHRIGSPEWEADKIETLLTREKTQAISQEAVSSLVDNDITIANPKQGRYFGEGGHGRVKFAAININREGKIDTVICTAKKMLLSSKIDNIKAEAQANGDTKASIDEKVKNYIATKCNSMAEESALQNKAGDDISPPVYGYSHTLNKKGENLLVVFMKVAPGISAIEFVNEKVDKLPIYKKKQLLLKLLQNAEKLHKKGIFHNDHKWDNYNIEPDKQKWSVLDYGLATTYRHQYDMDYDEVPCYYPPEVTELGVRIDSAKIDVYQLGIMVADILQTNREAVSEPFLDNSMSWNNTLTYQVIQKEIDKKLDAMTFPNPSVKALIGKMTKANPDERLTLAEAITQLKQMSLLRFPRGKGNIH
ncbi:MAG: serine/threonine-protein kinase [Endozoicomonas sp. (ex Botrylloides leachii)]|nr:serine/threonine-protein kinase [Endozoicomonas sp. (ex Botrylloides leachii)]